ncbi:hypothetical protein VIC_003259 [Vibrio coralliilyticus ATCC BAA-450]|nr:hypothetical protein VIC_003259 [Vibrio coralliilyticus ATCC BAA-450]
MPSMLAFGRANPINGTSKLIIGDAYYFDSQNLNLLEL